MVAALRVQELVPARPAPPRRRLELRLREQPADAGRRDTKTELGQFAADPPMAPARAATPTPEPPPAGSAVRAGRAPVATSGERAFDASAEASEESPEQRLATSAAGGRLRLQAALDQPSGVSAARPA